MPHQQLKLAYISVLNKKILFQDKKMRTIIQNFIISISQNIPKTQFDTWNDTCQDVCGKYVIFPLN